MWLTLQSRGVEITPAALHLQKNKTDDTSTGWNRSFHTWRPLPLPLTWVLKRLCTIVSFMADVRRHQTQVEASFWPGLCWDVCWRVKRTIMDWSLISTVCVLSNKETGRQCADDLNRAASCNSGIICSCRSPWTTYKLFSVSDSDVHCGSKNQRFLFFSFSLELNFLYWSFSPDRIWLTQITAPFVW